MTTKFNYRWKLSDLINIPKNGYKVFSCFCCGGGSSMGYKLAGFDVLGGNEIDPKIAAYYKANLKPQYLFIEPIQNFKNKASLPDELYQLDILDGSPPCSSFSMAGNRQKDWGKDKKFREGQQKQVLDTLFFDFIDLAARLQPKIVIAENVKGLILGEAKSYLREIIFRFEKAGYLVDFQVLNASLMGVPQRRERVFFYAVRKDLAKYLDTIDLFGNQPKLDLEFNEKEIPIKDFLDNTDTKEKKSQGAGYWEQCEPGESFSKYHKKGHYFGWFREDPNRPAHTLVASADMSWHPFIKRPLNLTELTYISTFPEDYLEVANSKKFLLGMSVPPVMMANIATRVKKQWLEKFSFQDE